MTEFCIPRNAAAPVTRDQWTEDSGVRAVSGQENIHHCSLTAILIVSQQEQERRVNY